MINVVQIIMAGNLYHELNVTSSCTYATTYYINVHKFPTKSGTMESY